MGSRVGTELTVRIKSIKAFGAVAITLLAMPVLAAAEGMKVGFVDVKAVATRSSTVQSAVKGAEDKLRAKQEEMEIHIRDFRSAKNDLETQKSVLSEEESRKKQQKIEDLRDKIDQMQSQIDKELRRTESDVMGPAVDRIIAAVKKIGKEQGYDLILTQDIVIYGSESHDLTPQVVQVLDAAPEPKAEEPAPAPPAKSDPKPKSEPAKTDAKKPVAKKKGK